MQFNYKKKYLAVLSFLTAGYFSLFFGLLEVIPIHTFCIFKGVTGIPCPACGSTRATLELFKGHFLNSLLINPFAIITNLLILISIIWIGIDLIKGRETYLPLLKMDWNTKTKLTVLSMICVNWIWNINKIL